jgi:hypothetical protein
MGYNNVEMYETPELTHFHKNKRQISYCGLYAENL